MNRFKLLISTFIIIFVAELGDKTQIASFSLAAEKGKMLSVIVGSSLALITTTIIAVLAGQFLNRFLFKKTLKIISGILFISTGVFLLLNQIFNFMN